MGEPYKEVKAGDAILAKDWNSIQGQIRDHILTHTHGGGESGAQIDVDLRALAAGAELSVRKLDASESLVVGPSSQPLLAVNPRATNTEGSYQVNVAGTLRADQVRATRLDGVTELAAGKLDVTGPAAARSLQVAEDAKIGRDLEVTGTSTMHGDAVVGSERAGGRLGVHGDGEFTGVVTAAALRGPGASDALEIVGAGPDEAQRVRVLASGGATVVGSMEVWGPATVADLTVDGPAVLKQDLNVTGTVTAARFAGEGAFVRGMIIMWSGNVRDIPAGWALCDGQDRRPDLRNRFIMGAGFDAEPGQSGEADSHAHRIAIPNATVPTTPAGAHRHGMPPSWYSRSDSARNVFGADRFNAIDRAETDVRSERTTEEGIHTHNVTVSYAEFSSGAQVGQNRPRWYAMCFIIKV